MKRLITMLLILALIVPAAACAEIKQGLGMTIQEFTKKYNEIQAPLDGPYLPLKLPAKWSYVNASCVAWYYPTERNDVVILLASYDQKIIKSISSRLDMIKIITPNDQFMSLISITERCASIFASDMLDISTSGSIITNLIKRSFEKKDTKEHPYDTLNGRIQLSFFPDDNSSSFSIRPGDETP